MQKFLISEKKKKEKKEGYDSNQPLSLWGRLTAKLTKNQPFLFPNVLLPMSKGCLGTICEITDPCVKFIKLDLIIQEVKPNCHFQLAVSCIFTNGLQILHTKHYIIRHITMIIQPSSLLVEFSVLHVVKHILLY